MIILISCDIIVTAAIGVKSKCAQSHQTTCEENTNKDVAGEKKPLYVVEKYI